MDTYYHSVTIGSFIRSNLIILCSEIGINVDFGSGSACSVGGGGGGSGFGACACACACACSGFVGGGGNTGPGMYGMDFRTAKRNISFISSIFGV